MRWLWRGLDVLQALVPTAVPTALVSLAAILKASNICQCQISLLFSKMKLLVSRARRLAGKVQRSKKRLRNIAQTLRRSSEKLQHLNDKWRDLQKPLKKIRYCNLAKHRPHSGSVRRGLLPSVSGSGCQQLNWGYCSTALVNPSTSGSRGRRGLVLHRCLQ